jgi:glutathione S-transferase
MCYKFSERSAFVKGGDVVSGRNNTMMKLYSGDLSPYAARVRMQIYAKGITDIAFELPTNFMTPAYREENPIGRVPVLAIGDDRIPESGVIAEYLEDIYPEPSLLGASPRETAQIRLIARIGDTYLLNNLFMLAGQRYAKEPNQGVVDLLVGQVVRNTRALDKMIGRNGFACAGRLTLADCTLVPAFFLMNTVLPPLGTGSPIDWNPNVAAYWSAIQANEHAAKILFEMQRGLDERLEQMRTGAFAQRMAGAAVLVAEDTAYKTRSATPA